MSRIRYKIFKKPIHYRRYTLYDMLIVVYIERYRGSMKTRTRILAMQTMIIIITLLLL